MHRTTLRRAARAAAFALASALAAPAFAQGDGKPPPAPAGEVPPGGGDADQEARERAAAEKAAQDARLKAEFERIAAELRDAVARFQTEMTALQQANTPREKWPPHPIAAHYTRFEELAMQDQPDALRWCLTAVGQIGAPAAEVAERKAELYARLVVVHPDQPWMADVARWLQADASPGGVGFDRVNLLLATLADATSVPATRAAALGTRAAILGQRPDPESRAEHQRILRVLAEKHADTTWGANAKGVLFQAEYLSVGRTPPDVTAVDTDGASFRLSDYRGKVVVLEFWGFW